MKESNKEISAACTWTANQFNKPNWKKAESSLNKRSRRSILVLQYSIMNQKCNRINHRFIRWWSLRLKLVKIEVKERIRIHYIKRILSIYKPISGRIRVLASIMSITNTRIYNLQAKQVVYSQEIIREQAWKAWLRRIMTLTMFRYSCPERFSSWRPCCDLKIWSVIIKIGRFKWS